MEDLGSEYQIDIDPGREPDLGFVTEWVQDKDNQLALLDCFFGHVKPEKSLCFFYAKEVPFVEDSRRVIIGVGWVRHVGDPVEYKYTRPGRVRSVLWERMIQHSIRPGFKDGFLLPYYDALEYGKEHVDFDPVSITAFAPEDRFEEFSYASELVTHDGAIASLLACAAALNRAKAILPGSFDLQLKWIHNRLDEIWKMRGPCPGLGAALCAFGIEFGTFVARELETKIGNNEDPWPVVEKMFQNPPSVLSKESAKHIGSTSREKWKSLPAERKALVKLLSRFTLNSDQAIPIYVQEERERIGIRCADTEILKNPYVIYELTRLTATPVSLWAIDRGIFPESYIRNKHLLPKPSALDGGSDQRRVRAFTVQQLEKACEDGHTLLPQKDIILGIRDLEIEPACNVDGDLMNLAERYFGDEIIKTQLADGTPCYQLSRLALVGEVIRNSILKRVGGKRHEIKENWRHLLDGQLPKMSSIPDAEKDQEERARKEKTAALKELAEARFSVLVGPAGTGKTTLLSVLCGQSQIASGEVLLLAPTGKARVRMEQIAKDNNLKLKGYTIAQFLSGCNRYDGGTGRYHLSPSPKETPAKTVIVDEASMLTEEMLGALIDALKGVDRLILIGDPRQLPPIGAGRPFMDIVSKLAPDNLHMIFPKIGLGYAELTIRRRQTGKKREDIQLAQWFSGIPLDPGADEVFDKILLGNGTDHIGFKSWETPDQFQKALSHALVEELGISSESDIAGFDKWLGGKFSGDFAYFNFGAAKYAEKWQILSPVRRLPHGVKEINRSIHKKYRSGMVEFAQRQKYRKIPKPMGPEQIVYGDKVINIVNHHRKKVYPTQNAEMYIANGEIGIIVGQFRTKNMKTPPWALKVEFSSQPNFGYDFTSRDFGDEAEPYLELAYALTVHKAQGSEFGKVIFSLPNPCRLLSRELLYTALTRQKERIVILHQGNRNDLKRFTSSEFSETARRLTNLFFKSKPIQMKGKFYEDRLIHCTLKGEMVRSKSELTIADRLTSNKVEYLYEHPLTIAGQTRYPDFFIEDEESGKKIYWEHCGMLLDPEYKARWERKLAWYRKNGILPYEEGGGPAGILIVTADSDKGAISSKDLETLIQKVILK
jgi:ATP-dependent exoDNAse (exonuclease V) alpha subunit